MPPIQTSKHHPFLAAKPSPPLPLAPPAGPHYHSSTTANETMRKYLRATTTHAGTENSNPSFPRPPYARWGRPRPRITRDTPNPRRLPRLSPRPVAMPSVLGTHPFRTRRAPIERMAGQRTRRSRQARPPSIRLSSHTRWPLLLCEAFPLPHHLGQGPTLVSPKPGPERMAQHRCRRQT